jgi:protein gp37
MMARSKIEWTDASWNPIRARNRATGRVGWHCHHKSLGCAFCYAEGFNIRLGTGLPYKPSHHVSGDVEIFLDEKTLLVPLKWKRPRMIFVCSMTDLFADFVTDEMIDRVFAVMALARQHQFQILTKRSARMRAYFERCAQPDSADFIAEDIRVAMTTLTQTPSRRERCPALKAILLGRFCQQLTWPLPNVWLGVSCEDQQRADERIPDLLQTPAAVRFVSLEPLLGVIDLTRIADPEEPGYTFDAFQKGHYCKMVSDDGRHHHGIGSYREHSLDWVITGGESGPKARPMHPDWERKIRDDCQAAGVPYFKKQWGEWAPRSDCAWYADYHTSLPMAIWDGERWRDDGGIDGEWMIRVGKKRAGRLLDGREHNDLPWSAA